MHEAGIAQDIIEVALRHLEADSHGRVRCLRLRLGELAGVNADSLDFAFEALSRGTPLEGARLDCEHVPLTLDCPDCGRRTGVEDWVFRCGACGSDRATVATGRELQFVCIDTDDPEEGAIAPD